MGFDNVSERPRGGFSFDNCQRNLFLQKQGIMLPNSRKTGTTIVGIVYKDGVVLGADTRATVGNLVSDKVCDKIHYLAKNMYVCGAGTAADTQQVSAMISSQLELHRLQTGRIVPVRTAERLIKQYLFKYQGYIGAALIIGGFDLDGPQIISIAPHGSSDRLPYTTMGSGSLAAISVFESGWKPNMELDEAKKLVCNAVKAGIFYDLGSGSNVDICVITKDKAEHIRPFEVANVKGVRSGDYQFKIGTTAVLSSLTIPIVVEDVSVKHIDGEAMDTTS